ncbi:MAG TPA: hypothetical protein VIV12_05945 [Streptosporangiaceae bacterium]
MSAVILNIVIGLVTSVLSGSSVWFWQRVDKTRMSRSKAAFFGLHPGGTCLIVMNHRWNDPRSTHQNDVHAMIEIGALATEIGVRVSLKSCDDIRESNSDRTEFCVGGPISNPRAAGHLAAHLPGISVSPSRRDGLAITAGGERFVYDRGTLAYVAVAKFTPATATRPVILICGQSAITNRAAVYLLKRDYRHLKKTLGSADRFCLILRVTAPDVYGHEMVEVAKDVSDTAFMAQPSPRDRNR